MSEETFYSAVICRANDQPELVDTLFHFRARLFVEKCGWDLPLVNGRERDRFDREDTVHCALMHQGALVGTFRAIRCDRPYLASEVFPQLAASHPFPNRSDRWEISRFGVLSRNATLRHARFNYAVMFHFAREVRARSLVAVADLTYERFLSSLGVRTRRYGPPQLIGRTTAGKPLRAVAGEIPLAAQNSPRFERLVNAIRHVEIIDAAQILGPARIPA